MATPIGFHSISVSLRPSQRYSHRVCPPTFVLRMHESTCQVPSAARQIAKSTTCCLGEPYGPSSGSSAPVHQSRAIAGRVVGWARAAFESISAATMRQMNEIRISPPLLEFHDTILRARQRRYLLNRSRSLLLLLLVGLSLSSRAADDFLPDVHRILF